MQMRPTPMAGTQKYIPAVNDGYEFGVANIMQQRGQLMAKFCPKDSRAHTSGSNIDEIQGGPLVEKTNFKSVETLGLSRSHGFKAALFNEIIKTALATGDLTISDTKNVPISALVPSWKALMAGKIDFAIGAYGSGFMKLIAKKTGGIRFIRGYVSGHSSEGSENDARCRH